MANMEMEPKFEVKLGSNQNFCYVIRLGSFKSRIIIIILLMYIITITAIITTIRMQNRNARNKR